MSMPIFDFFTERLWWIQGPQYLGVVLADNDIIDISNYGPNPPADGCTFTLHTANRGMWWKSVRICDRSTGQELAAVTSEHGQVSHWTRFTYDKDIDPNNPPLLVLAKAKTLGAHTDMYLIDPLDFSWEGMGFQFEWKQD